MEFTLAQESIKFLIKSVGEEYQVLKGGGNIMAVGKNMMWKKGERGSKIISTINNIEAVWRNIKCDEEEGDGNFGKKIKINKTRGVEEYQGLGNIIHPCLS